MCMTLHLPTLNTIPHLSAQAQSWSSAAWSSSLSFSVRTVFPSFVSCELEPYPEYWCRIWIKHVEFFYYTLRSSGLVIGTDFGSGLDPNIDPVLRSADPIIWFLFFEYSDSQCCGSGSGAPEKMSKLLKIMTPLTLTRKIKQFGLTLRWIKEMKNFQFFKMWKTRNRMGWSGSKYDIKIESRIRIGVITMPNYNTANSSDTPVCVLSGKIG